MYANILHKVTILVFYYVLTIYSRILFKKGTVI